MQRLFVRVGDLLEMPLAKANKILLYRSSCSVLVNSMWKRHFLTWTSDYENRVVTASSRSLGQRRFKSQKKKSEDSDTESEDEDDVTAEDDFEFGKDFKDITVNSPSLRVDAVIKAGLSIARNKAEDAVYDSRVRINGQKIFKKGTKVDIGDEVDLIVGINPNNENFLDIRRLVVRDIKERSHGDKYALLLRRFKALTVENYSDPWKGPAAE